MNIQIIKCNNPKLKPLDENTLGFGNYFTDHMFVADYNPEEGWNNARVVPYGPFEIEPSSMVFHYAQEIFEGAKCYRNNAGGFNLFRIKDNFKRLNKSAKRLCMPEIPIDLCMSGLLSLLALDKEWTPKTEGYSLYIRPTMIATDNHLGVKPSKTYKFFIILSPVGPYYKNGLSPISIYIEDKYVRSVKGGMGYAKTGGNYAGSILAGEIAKNNGYDQVLWIDGKHRKYVDEVGSMNIMFVYKNKHIVTPQLNGNILAGITRDSILKLCDSFGYSYEEKDLPIEEIISDIKKGNIVESFGTGTAAIISPIKTFGYLGTDYCLGEYTKNSIAMKLFDKIIGIQTGKEEDKLEWITHIE